MSSPFKSLQGETLKGRFLIQDFLEKGGMSSIYLAWDQIDKRHVVVKTLPRELADHPKLIERTEREGKAIASLNHPNIIRIYDHFKIDDGRPAIVLDFMQGGSIRTLLSEYQEKNRAMPIDYALSLMIPIIDAMSFAHAIQIIHRDLKPTNILLHHDRRSAVVADLGVARNLLESRITKTNAVLGTPYYMSYEQAAGREIDARTDIYAIGVILYEMITTRRPYHVNNIADLLSAMQTQTPYPVTKLRQSASPKLEAVIHKCLQIKADDRYQTMTLLLNDLKEAREHQSTYSYQPDPSNPTPPPHNPNDISPNTGATQPQQMGHVPDPHATGSRSGIILGVIAALVFLAFVALILFLMGVFG
ncbi:MAG: serine/threonine protein kinase [Anaerolineae bacterium]